MTFIRFLDDLTPDARQIWISSEERHAALRDIVEATSTSARQNAIFRMDRAVVEALAAVGLLRGPVQGIEFQSGFVPWNGRKHPDCTLFLSQMQLINAVRLDQLDVYISSWIHESLHARQPYRDTSQVSREWPGYEEGLVGALTQRVLTAGGITGVRHSFPYYETGYEVFSLVAEVDMDLLLRLLWSHPTGYVRQAFGPTINEMRSRNGLSELDRLQLAGDLLFRVDRMRNLPDRNAMTKLLMRIVQ